MTGLTMMFVVVFVLVLAAVCALLVLRMLGPMELPESPPFPRRRHPFRRHVHAAGAPATSHQSEELVGKR